MKQLIYIIENSKDKKLDRRTGQNDKTKKNIKADPDRRSTRNQGQNWDIRLDRDPVSNRRKSSGSSIRSGRFAEEMNAIHEKRQRKSASSQRSSTAAGVRNETDAQSRQRRKRVSRAQSMTYRSGQGRKAASNRQESYGTESRQDKNDRNNTNRNHINKNNINRNHVNKEKSIRPASMSGKHSRNYKKAGSVAGRSGKKRRSKRSRIGSLILLLLCLALVACALVLYFKRDKLEDLFDKIEEATVSKSEILAEAETLAQGYDYDAAIEKIKTIDGYEEDKELAGCIADWEETKENLIGYSAGDVTHIFYHTLVYDTELAFECAPSIAEGFKEWMTTIDEFDKITETMYREGYVLCSLYDFFDESYDDDGTPHFTEKKVYLPEGKKPFVLSLDDLSYYHTYTGHGMATKLVLDENGKITCEYENTDGSIVTGAYDCVPRINEFMEKHPDGAYRGARGTIALTGYNGVFGYRTDKSYVTKKNLDADKVEWLEDHPDYDYDEECEQAKAIADELKAEGWTFASHTWGHIRVGNASLKKIKTDTKKWLENVEPIIGETECIIFAHGQDLASTDDYNVETNKKYKYLASQGFHIFLNVDSHQKTMQVHDLYVHGGRRNLDGYRLWQDAHGYSDWTSDLFNAADILDSRRKDMPTPDE